MLNELELQLKNAKIENIRINEENTNYKKQIESLKMFNFQIEKDSKENIDLMQKDLNELKVMIKEK